MYVIQGTTGTGTVVTNSNLLISTTYIFPADRCVFTPAVNDDATNTYSIATAFFIGLTHSGGAETGKYLPLTNPKLGYLGKTGRFVEISN